MAILADHERVGETLETRIPGDDRRVILVGGAAIRWHLTHRGLDDSSLPPLRDVDIIADGTFLGAIRRHNPDGHEMANGSKFVVEPTTDEQQAGIVTLEAFVSPDGEYNHPLIPPRKHKYLLGCDLMAPQNMDRINGRRVLELPLVLWWKMFIGRDGDVETVQKVMKILNDQNGMSNEERRRIVRLLIAAQSSDSTLSEEYGSYLPHELLRPSPIYASTR